MSPEDLVLLVTAAAGLKLIGYIVLFIFILFALFTLEATRKHAKRSADNLDAICKMVKKAQAIKIGEGTPPANVKRDPLEAWWQSMSGAKS